MKSNENQNVKFNEKYPFKSCPLFEIIKKSLCFGTKTQKRKKT